ncbi:SRPBCC domain-containing protein [Flavobacterium sp. SH_e]|uniref:SRPBCC domain-containing protein n=1 Tax=Flavobacterium sp. SH_e TaxID=2983767 RepID=UPI0021E3C00A|nr:SRPBCC domain-containing protein [Flavobacterium sp. SH_e]MCV2486312.1 SRPBCC domain-containing protein [Flavobacterium sp. SH_e]
MIKVQNTINASIEKVWKLWTLPEHIMNWNNASLDWHTPYVENDLKVGSKFKFTMALKDGSDSFDFEGIYTKIEKFSLIEYKLFDDRTASVHFDSENNAVTITEIFEPTTPETADMEEQFCTAIIQNFKNYVESF